MSIDQRLRRALQPHGSDPGPDTLAALRLVEERVAQGARRTRRAVVVLVVVSLLGVGVGGALVARGGGPGRDPVVTSEQQPLLGTYVADVGDSRFARREALVGRWILTLEQGGVLDLRPPPSYVGATTGAAYRVRGDELRTDALFEPGCQATRGYVGTYGWSFVDQRLTFTLVEDECAVRRVLFTAQSWDRVP